eukprot:CAMPEP_0172668796 /NCGR_PEP_ID=MMETSP1074-20121228/9281_1 /TAXON_ID=2916 /ORGANISM="Ceratium fusus, Strain PA161109" /LENGTH=404 /DNA_ID=CAMNT_0013485483 /DNA_START=87 /DNA_END=1301 /DNA_ORIENTATION=+
MTAGNLPGGPMCWGDAASRKTLPSSIVGANRVHDDDEEQLNEPDPEDSESCFLEDALNSDAVNDSRGVSKEELVIGAAEPKPGSSEPVANSLSKARIELPAALLQHDVSFIGVSLRHSFACAPLPRDHGVLRARVVRRRHGRFGFPRFLLYIEPENGEDIFIVAAEKQAARRPYYVVATHEYNFDRDSQFCVGRLQGNMLCTQYIFNGRWHNPRRSCNKGKEQSEEEEDEPREELAMVRFHKPGDAPRSMEVVLPRVRSDGTREELRPKDPLRDGLRRAWGKGRSVWQTGDADGDLSDEEPWINLSSPEPKWDETRQVYTMDFGGRVSRTSAKNFQLAIADRCFRPFEGPDGGEVGGLCMQFGRVDDDDTFVVDISYPLSPAQALAIGMSMFDSRLAETFKMYY